jgi:branched-chain amino acid transport system substrate-binding protein
VRCRGRPRRLASAVGSTRVALASTRVALASTRVALATTTVALALVACGTSPPDHVRLGVAAPLSGPRAAIGEELVRGAELAVADLNAAGGLLDHDVELVVTDAADLVDLPRRLADLAERARVTAVIGPEAPGVLVGPRSPLTRRRVAAVLPSAFAGELEGASTVVTRTVPSARAQAEAVARWLVGERQATGLAVLVADPVEGSAARTAIEAGAAAGGLPPTAVVEVDGAATQLGPAVGALQRAAPDADAVLLWGWPDATARATLAVRARDWDVQIVVPSSAFVGTYRTLTGAASEGVVLPFPFREAWFGPELTTWMLRYHATHGLGALPGLDTLVLDVPVVALAAYDAVGAIATAVTEAGSRDPARVAAALPDVEHDGLLRAYDLADRESWTAGDLYLARFHRLGVVYDTDPRLDPEAQRTFWELQVSAEFLLELAPTGPLRDLVDRIVGDDPGSPPSYEPPLPAPGPVGRP